LIDVQLWLRSLGEIILRQRRMEYYNAILEPIDMGNSRHRLYVMVHTEKSILALALERRTTNMLRRRTTPTMSI
jgi:hypothetical protein